MVKGQIQILCTVYTYLANEADSEYFCLSP